jgi:hypothetical protein
MHGWGIVALAIGLVLAGGARYAVGQDLNPAIHYATQSPPDARYELLQSALVVRITLLVDRYSGDVYASVRSNSDGLLWERIPRKKAQNEKIDASRVNFQVFTSGLAVKYTYLLNVQTGQSWILVNNKNGYPVWEPMPELVPANTPR